MSSYEIETNALVLMGLRNFEAAGFWLRRKVRKQGQREQRITDLGDRVTLAWFDRKPYVIEIEEIAP